MESTMESIFEGLERKGVREMDRELTTATKRPRGAQVSAWNYRREMEDLCRTYAVKDIGRLSEERARNRTGVV